MRRIGTRHLHRDRSRGTRLRTGASRISVCWIVRLYMMVESDGHLSVDTRSRDLRSAMLWTRRPTGTARAYSILLCIASCLIKLLQQARKCQARCPSTSQAPCPPQHPRIARQARNRDANVIVDADHLLLVRREFAGGALREAEPCLLSPSSCGKNERSRPTLRVSRIACVLEHRPTAADPCLTASWAYSTCASGGCRDQLVNSRKRALASAHLMQASLRTL